MDVFYALADPNRRNIIEMLAAHGEMPSTSIAKRFHITPSAISQHLKILKEAKLVKVEKRAQKRIYRVNADTVRQLEQWAQTMTESYDRLETLLKKGV